MARLAISETDRNRGVFELLEMSSSTSIPKPPSEAESLLEALRAGEDREEIYRRIYELYSGSVFACFRHHGFSTEDCHDLTQETFLRAFRSLGTYRRQARFKTWLYEIARNVWRNELRNRLRLKRDGKVVRLEGSGNGDSNHGSDEGLPISSAEPGPIENLLAKEEAELLRQELAKLPPRMRECLQLRLDQGLKFREIAVLVQISIDTVKSQLAQGKKRLRLRLGEDLRKYGF